MFSLYFLKGYGQVKARGVLPEKYDSLKERMLGLALYFLVYKGN